MQGRIICINTSIHKVLLENNTILDCKTRGKLRNMDISPVVGDFVIVDTDKQVIEKVLKREKAKAKSTYETGGLIFDFEQMHFKKDGQEIELSKTGQKLLRMLVENRGITLSRACAISARG